MVITRLSWNERLKNQVAKNTENSVRRVYVREFNMYKNEKTLVLQYAQPNLFRSVYEYLLTWTVFLLNSYLLFKSIHFNFFFILPLIFLQALIVIRIFILQHDCGHYALFKNRLANNLAGMLCSLFTTMTYHFWRDTHATHHRDNGDLHKRPWVGAIDVFTVEEFNQLTDHEKKRYKLKKNPYVILMFGWLYHFYNYRICTQSFNKSIMTKNKWVQTHLSNLAQLILFTIIAILCSVKFLLLAIILPMVFSYCVGIFLFFIQHNFESSYFYHQDEQIMARNELFMKSSFEGSSCFLLPSILTWVTGNIGYHHIHHACPKVPFYYLKKMYDTYPELQKVYTITLKNSFKQFSYVLYNPATKRMLSWDEYNKMVFVN